MKQKEKKKIKDVMDGAVFPAQVNENDTPEDFMNGPDGLRPHMAKKPEGEIIVDLEHGIKGRTIPPRSIWAKGDWAGNTGSDYNTWVVSGEGTPGNHEFRKYKIPQQLCNVQAPKHPQDWPKYLKEPTTTSTSKPWSSGSGSGSSSGSSSSSSSGLPWGLRVRCPGCGHFFKMDDLATHAKNACPANQGEVAMWVIKCECHDNLQDTAKVLEGFPLLPPDVSGDQDGDGSQQQEFPHADLVPPKEGEEDGDEAGGGAESQSAASATT